MERLGFCWHDEVTQDAEDFDFVQQYVHKMSFIHEACFALLVNVVNRPEMQLEEPCSMEDVMSFGSLAPSAHDVWPVQLHIWPDYELTPILTKDEFWKVRMIHACTF